jgi:hypothetical protein
MKATPKYAMSAILSILIATHAAAGTQLLLKRGDHHQHPGEIAGIVDLTIDPEVENAKVNVTVDGQRSRPIPRAVPPQRRLRTDAGAAQDRDHRAVSEGQARAVDGDDQSRKSSADGQGQAHRRTHIRGGNDVPKNDPITSCSSGTTGGGCLSPRSRIDSRFRLAARRGFVR